jgi:hypothetical protein
MAKEEKEKGGIDYYKRKGLQKSIILHLSSETHKKLKYLAWHRETSVQKLLVKTIEDIVKGVELPEKEKGGNA